MAGGCLIIFCFVASAIGFGKHSLCTFPRLQSMQSHDIYICFGYTPKLVPTTDFRYI